MGIDFMHKYQAHIQWRFGGSPLQEEFAYTEFASYNMDGFMLELPYTKLGIFETCIENVSLPKILTTTSSTHIIWFINWM